jgi:hypothetical protein
MRQRNLDAGGNTFYSYKRTMLPFLFGIIARFALVLGIAFILGKTYPPTRFIGLFFCSESVRY